MFIGIYKLTRMFFATLRGSDTPRQLAFGIALGMLIGIVPKDSLIVVAIGLLIVGTNVNVLMATVSGFAFTWVGFLLEPVSHKVGLYVLTQEQLAPTFVRLYETPVVPWTRFNDTIVCGSLLIGLLSLIPMYQLSRIFFTHITPGIHKSFARNRAYAWLSGANRDEDSLAEAKRRRAVKWSWVLPRVAIIALLFGLVYLYQDRVIEYGIEQSGSSIVGAKVEIGRVKTSLADGSIRLHDIRIANPNSPMTDAVRAKYAGVDFNTQALLKKKLVIQESKLVGVEFNSQRTTSGELAERPRGESGEPGFLSEKAKELGKEWADDLKDVAVSRLEDNLETVKVSKELIEYWPKEYEIVRKRADRLEQNVKKLRELKELKLNNPLRDFQKYQDALANINQTQKEIERLHLQLKTMRQKFNDDRKALLAAKEIDKENISSLVKTSTVSGQSLTEILLGSTQGKRVDEVLGWVRWMRETVPDPESDFKPNRTRGTVILFPGLKQTPDLLVQRAVLSGKGTVGDDLYQFTGTLKDITSHPKMHGKPTVINLATEANTDLKIRAIIDQTGEKRIDTLLIRCPKIDLDRQQLGSDNSVRVSIAPAKMDLAVNLRMIGDRIAGRIVLTQTNVKMSLDQLPSGIRDEEIMAIIDQELSKVEMFQVVMKLSGKIDEPKLDFESDLGNQLALVLNSSLQRAIDSQVAKLNKRVDRVTREKLSELNTLVAARHAEIVHLLESHGVDIAQLQQTVKRVMDLPLLRR